MGTELTGSPRRSTNLQEYDSRALDLGQELAELKLRVEALTLDLEDEKKQVHTLTGAVSYRDERIAELQAQNSNLLMRCAEVATHIVQMKKIADTAVGSLDRTLVDVRNGAPQQQIASDEIQRPN